VARCRECRRGFGGDSWTYLISEMLYDGCVVIIALIGLEKWETWGKDR
jgi:hypothetical protein